MVDALRAYRRWLWRRLIVLGPAAGLAAAVVLLLGASSTPLWVRVTALALGALVAAPVVWLLAQTLAAARLHGARRPRQARLLRRDLRSLPLIACASLVLLAVLARVPALFPEESAPPIVALRASADAFTMPDTEPPSVERVEQPSPALAPAVKLTPEPPAPSPSLQRDIVIGDVEQDEEGRPRFDPLADGLPPVRLRDEMVFERLRMPELADPYGRVPATATLDVLYLIANQDARGPAGCAQIDLPFTRAASFRASVLGAVLSEVEEVSERFTLELNGDGVITWEHVTLEFAHRLFGYTRRAPFDVAVSVGLSLDTFDFPDREVESSARPAPYVAVEAALWETSVFSLSVRVGQSIPVNLSGNTASVTDVSVTMRLDLSERVSVRLGCRALFVGLRDYEEALDSGVVADRRERIMGPFVGVDVAF